MRSENILTTPIPVSDIPGPLTFSPVTMGEAKRKPARHQNKPTLDQLMDEEWRNLTNHDAEYASVAARGLDETGLTSTVPVHSRSLIVKSMPVGARLCQ